MKNQAIKHTKKKKLALKLGTQTIQILTSNDEVCIPSLSSIISAVRSLLSSTSTVKNIGLMPMSELFLVQVDDF